jgi:hypothetical protein
MAKPGGWGRPGLKFVEEGPAHRRSKVQHATRYIATFVEDARRMMRGGRYSGFIRPIRPVRWKIPGFRRFGDFEVVPGAVPGRIEVVHGGLMANRKWPKKEERAAGGIEG